MRRLIDVVIILSLTALTGPYSEENRQSHDYTRLTKEEVENWLNSVSYDTLLEFIIKYDVIEHSVPCIEKFSYIVFITKDGDVVAKPQPEKIKIIIGVPPDTLEYTVTLPEYVYPNMINLRMKPVYVYIIVCSIVVTGISLLLCVTNN